MLKSVVDEDRPCRTVGRAIIAGTCPPPGDWSFPSNHATMAGALAVTTLLLSRRLGLVALPLAVLAAFSRVFVGVHYPHDVVAGVLLGALVAATGHPAAGPPDRRGAAPPRRPCPSPGPHRPAAPAPDPAAPDPCCVWPDDRSRHRHCPPIMELWWATKRP